MSAESNLRQVSLITGVEAEDLAGVLLENEWGLTPSIHTDAATGRSTVSVYVELPKEQILAVRQRLKASWDAVQVDASHLGAAEVRIRKVRPLDWAESWKRHFRPMEIGSRLLIKPTWSRRRPRSGQVVLQLDPGLSFGTGQHATTHFCLTQVVGLRHSGPQSLLDLGCGSGILALAGALLGYEPVEAWDFDPEAVRIAAENATLNGLEQRVRPALKDVTQLPEVAEAQFDVVCANLMHDLLISERDRIGSRVVEDGHLVLAGILTSQFTAVRSAYLGRGWELEESATGGEWTSGSFRRTSTTSKSLSHRSTRRGM
jgi:ribosomal protein L11 methyltransferase